MRHSRSYRVISEFHLCIFAVSLFHVSLPGKTEKSARPITSRLCGYKKDYATDCLNKQFTLRGVFHMVGVTGFEPTASWSRTKRATNCATPRKEKPQQLGCCGVVGDERIELPRAESESAALPLCESPSGLCLGRLPSTLIYYSVPDGICQRFF